jgi:peptidoglycan hydrolase-like protein with peptidoglycan-binding domain
MKMLQPVTKNFTGLKNMVSINSSNTSPKQSTFKLPTLRQGSSGSVVRVLQQLLKFKGFSLAVDGEFSCTTEEAVKQFQQMNDLAVDGIVDAKTWYHLSLGILPFSC